MPSYRALLLSDWYQQYRRTPPPFSRGLSRLSEIFASLIMAA
jgi:hypothetical protein